MRFSFFAFIIVYPWFLLTGCKDDRAEKSNPATLHGIPIQHPDLSIPGSFIKENKQIFDSSDIESFIDSFPFFRPIVAELRLFYRKRSWSYAWFDQAGLTETAQHLYNCVVNINQEGLPDKILYKSELIALMENQELYSKGKTAMEIMLTAQYISYSKLAWSGLSKSELASIKWHLPRKESSYSVLLDSILNDKALLDNAPMYYQYYLLRQQLKKYNDIQAHGGWPFTKSPQKNLAAGDTSEIVSEIKKRLSVTGEYVSNDFGLFFDSSLEKSIKIYQESNGMKETGKISPELVRRLNITVEKRIEDIMVNMERCRWLPVTLGKAYLLINIPEYRLHLFENEQEKWNMKIVVGKSKNPTAIFSGEIKYVVFCPYWNVPNSILVKEILPAVRKSPGYLQRHHMEWHEGSVRQLPGPDNALGIIKFLFPNSHNIYLHDTPVKSLFGEDKRAFSHGCIRLEEPLKLAKYVLQNDNSWNDSAIAQAIKTGKEKYVTVKNPLSVYITYLTAWVDAKKGLQFRDDIYGLNDRLIKMIMEKPAL